MPRTLRTLLLSATVLGALATAAAAAPPAPASATGMAGMAGMHATMMADAALHESMMDDPAMLAHMGEYGIDVDAMQADCPMLGGGSTATMHGGGPGHLGHHGDTSRR